MIVNHLTPVSTFVIASYIRILYPELTGFTYCFVFILLFFFACHCRYKLLTTTVNGGYLQWGPLIKQKK